MQISFHGAAQMVTGSKHLLETNQGVKILLDCGMFQGNPAEADELNRHWGFDPRTIDAVLLSHAHIDHCGLIPRLVAEGFAGKIYCTPATFDLAKILMLDSAHIQESDVQYHNKKRQQKGQSDIKALYTIADVYEALSCFVKVAYEETIHPAPGISAVFTDVGHIIGSAAVHVTVTEGDSKTVISFSGDVGRYNDELLNAPKVFPQADYVILESTYGNSLHEDLNIKDRRLLEIIYDTCIKRRGKLVIPAFSVGRTQEIIYALNRLEISKKLPDIDFYVDSPLSVEATAVMKNHQNELNQAFKDYMLKDAEPFDFKRLHYITNVQDSIALNKSKEPCVIISASGMADAGRVKHHIKHVIADSRNTILLVGYCEPRSLGGKLMAGYQTVTIFGDEFKVNARIESLRSLSAHADYDDLCRFVACQDASKIKKLFLVHGEPDVQTSFKTRLAAKGFKNIEIPALHDKFEL